MAGAGFAMDLGAERGFCAADSAVATIATRTPAKARKLLRTAVPIESYF